MPSLPKDTERLAFRFWREEDLPLALCLWGDRAVTAMISRDPLTEAAVRERLVAEIARLEDHGIQYWPIFLRSSGEHVGCCGLRPYDPRKKIYELGVHLRSAFWGQGLATEAARAAMDFAFDKLAAASLFAGHHPQNVASRHLLEKLGFAHTHDELYPPTGLLHPSYLFTREDALRARVGRAPPK